MIINYIISIVSNFRNPKSLTQLLTSSLISIIFLMGIKKPANHTDLRVLNLINCVSVGIPVQISNLFLHDLRLLANQTL